MIMVMTIMVILVTAGLPVLEGVLPGTQPGQRGAPISVLDPLRPDRADQPKACRSSCGSTPRQAPTALEAVVGLHGNADQPDGLSPWIETSRSRSSAPSSVLIRSNYWTQAQAQFGAVTQDPLSTRRIHQRHQPGKRLFAAGGRRDRQIWIAETPTHMRYDIQTGQPPPPSKRRALSVHAGRGAGGDGVHGHRHSGGAAGHAGGQQAGEVAERKMIAARIGNNKLNELKVTGQLQNAAQRGAVQEGGLSFKWTVKNETWTETP